MRYFLTFACYGAHLHGDNGGSVDRRRNLPGSRLLEVDERRAQAERKQMLQPPYVLDRPAHETVLTAILGHCALRG